MTSLAEPELDAAPIPARDDVTDDASSARFKLWVGLASILAAAGFLAFGQELGLQFLLLLVGAIAAAGAAYLLWQLDPAYTICMGFFLSPFAGNWGLLGFPSGLDPDRYLLTFGIIQVLFRAHAVRNRPRFKYGPVHFIIVLALAYVVVSAYLAATLFLKQPLFEIIDSFGLLPFLMFLVVPIAFRTARQRSILLFTFVAMGLYLALTSVFAAVHLNALVFPRYILDPHVGLQFGRARGPFVDAVANGFGLSVCGLASVVAATNWTGPRARMTARIVAGLCAIGVLLSLERSVWLGAGAGVIVAILVTERLRRYALTAIMVAAVGLGVVFLLVPALGHQVSKRAGDSRSLWDRENLATASLNMLEARPLGGFGWNKFQADSRLYFQQSQNFPLTATSLNVHNFLLGYAVELGLPGLTLWFLALLLGVFTAFTSRGPPDLVAWRTGLIAVFVLFLVVADSVPPTLFPNLSIWLWAGVVFSGRYARSERQRGEPRSVPPAQSTERHSGAVTPRALRA